MQAFYHELFTGFSQLRNYEILPYIHVLECFLKHPWVDALNRRSSREYGSVKSSKTLSPLIIGLHK
jgi:hypothetical protein